MTMKKHIKIYIVLIILFSPFYSCDVLDLEPISTLTEANFFKTSDDMDRAVLGIYSRYQSRKPRDWSLFEMPTDHLYMSSYRFIGGLEALNNLDFHPQNDILRNFWQATYNGIFRSNSVLVNLDNPEDYAGNEKSQYEGEARFMRALFYFDLVRVFGGVPRVTSVLTVEETKNVPRATEEEIYALIKEDLTAAVSLLPPYSEMAKGRSSKAAAMALLGKVFVYTEEWDQAVNMLDQVIALDFDLVDDYGDLWKEETEDNSEVIFAMKYSPNDNGHILSRDFLPYFGVEGYSSTAGGEVALPAWSAIKVFVDEDQRKDATFSLYWRSPGSNEEPSWRPYISKFLAQNASSSGLDLPVIRYADVLLLKAEASYYLGNTQAALDALNEVRSRAFQGNSHNYVADDIASAEDFVDILLLERQLEFAYENERWMDLVRKDRMIEVMKEVEWNYNPTTGQAQVVRLDPQEHHRLFPIPQHEIDQSEPGIIVQNPGY